MLKALEPMLAHASLTLLLHPLADGKVNLTVIPKMHKVDATNPTAQRVSESEILRTPLALTGTLEELETGLPVALQALSTGYVSLVDQVTQQIEKLTAAAKAKANAKSAATKPSAAKTPAPAAKSAAGKPGFKAPASKTLGDTQTDDKEVVANAVADKDEAQDAAVPNRLEALVPTTPETAVPSAALPVAINLPVENVGSASLAVVPLAEAQEPSTPVPPEEARTGEIMEDLSGPASAAPEKAAVSESAIEAPAVEPSDPPKRKGGRPTNAERARRAALASAEPAQAGTQASPDAPVVAAELPAPLVSAEPRRRGRPTNAERARRAALAEAQTGQTDSAVAGPSLDAAQAVPPVAAPKRRGRPPKNQQPVAAGQADFEHFNLGV